MATINFKGKEIVRNYHLTVPYHELKPDEKKSLTKKIGLNDNLIIHGDNLLALKALLATYAGKVKCIYIDPPYNTGNEKWAYNDNVNSPMMKEWLGKVVDKDDLTRHDKWLCMMMPRLKLLRELLCDDGVIFVSIDDNEAQHLRMLMDEVFREENFITQITVQSNPRGSQSSKHVATVHEYILFYTKDIDELEISGFELPPRTRDEFRYTYKDGRKYRFLGLRQRGGAWKKEDRPNLFFPIYINRETGEVSLVKSKLFSIEVLPKRPSGEESRWKWNKEKIENNKEFLIGKKVSRSGEQDFWDIFQIDFLTDEEGKERTSKLKTIWVDKLLNYQNGRTEIKEIFEGKDIFDYPKPTYLVRNLVEALGYKKDDVILDSFAGSGTTAHAVLALNKEDGGNRKFILVQLPEEIEKDKPAYKFGFRQVIDITAERVRRVIKGVKSAKDESLQKGLGGTFSYFELGKPIDAERILKGEDLPTFMEMARYIFYTATGEEFNEKKIDEKTGFIGESKEYKVYLLYKPDLEYLKNTALTLDFAQKLGKSSKKRLVFAPTKYLDHEHLERLGIEFAQLPFDIYQKQ